MQYPAHLNARDYLATLPISGDRKLMVHQIEHGLDHHELGRSLNGSETGSGSS